ncbi:MAG: IS1595 family transposase [Parcubacteria group bacterium CG10_big_fil_rev_8_21_14_0_10_41_35]|nr:MAG: IS1595 family transposase [Parcubacteria group bacterium CG10_big_fil_rev_8_21_14_0_10_41_35]
MPLIPSKSTTILRIRISDKKFAFLIRSFAADLTALQTAKVALLNRNTINRYFGYFRRQIIAQALREREEQEITNGVEVDESYFGPRRQRGKRGRGAGKKTVVLGLLKRNGKVYAQIIPDASQAEILPIIRQTVKSGADIYTDGWRSYDALAIYGYNHKKVNHQKNDFAHQDIHINGVESFWSWTKRRLAKFNGVPKLLFGANLLESEWRFNHRSDILKQIRKLIRFRRRNLHLI